MLYNSDNSLIFIVPYGHNFRGASTNFNNSFTTEVKNELQRKLELNLPPLLKSATTLHIQQFYKIRNHNSSGQDTVLFSVNFYTALTYGANKLNTNIMLGKMTESTENNN